MANQRAGETMAVKQERKPNEEAENQGQGRLDVLIGEQVILALGRPADLQRLQVRHLWEGCYRVNIFVGENIATGRVANSYFVQASAEGRILETNPTITKQY